MCVCLCVRVNVDVYMQVCASMQGWRQEDGVLIPWSRMTLICTVPSLFYGCQGRSPDLHDHGANVVNC